MARISSQSSANRGDQPLRDTNWISLTIVSQLAKGNGGGRGNIKIPTFEQLDDEWNGVPNRVAKAVYISKVNHAAVQSGYNLPCSANFPSVEATVDRT